MCSSRWTRHLALAVPRLVVTLFTLAFLAPTPASAAKPFTLDDVLSAPFPSGLVAAPHAPRVAWVENDRGVRNVFTAAAPGFEPLRLTGYTDDDGVTLSQLALTPDGSLLVYVRGGGPNRTGEAPNPASLPGGVEQAIWAVPTDGSAEPRKLAPGSGPVLSPDGALLVYADGGRVMEIDLAAACREDGEASEPEAGDDGSGSENGAEADEDEAAAPRELFRVRGGVGALAWSPDGRRIAFVSNRDTHSFVGVFTRDTERAIEAIRWIDPSVDRDLAPVWSPEGNRVAFLRLPGAKAGEPLDLTGGVPFSVRVAEVATGTARELWASLGDGGGFAQWYPEEPLRWAAGDRLLFTSEHPTPAGDGPWLHVYSLPATEGGEPTDLTPGPCVAAQSALSPDRTTLYVSSNCGDVDRRHLWRVPVEGGEAVRITGGAGIETDPVPLFGETVVALRRADGRRPPAVSLVSRDGGAVRAVSPELPDAFPVEDLVEPEQVVFEAADGLEIHGQLFPARRPAGEPGPAVIFMHGGPFRQMLLGWHPRQYYAWAYGMNQYLASRGMTVLSVNYRSGTGYGRSFRQAAGQGPRGATEYRDILAAGLYLRRLPGVDPERIGLWGGSYGGYLTALGLARDSDLFAAGVDLHGVHDWALRATDFIPGAAWGLTEDLLEGAHAASPVANLDYWTSPVLLVHGDDDRNVLFLQTTDLVRRLRERQVPVEILVLPDEVHGFLRQASWLATYGRAAEFFEKTLGGQ